ncbi:Pimeloyl-ACP methyl ester carboxylesterase [Marinobacter daqiaonensis]|uniref:Pimeloyl-ACP methyl ester carboxylesterase n=1 Tax=Marinobacter daqiaonensis TaxID=650891 RepID=A0A1I6II41_9GAMM|nr:alpha/beta hydrolase [Marinobacter daqiaonensis]SFR66415.1 Pimeloyl-ACP methyl ester carboxylesterase [Marinobacter daqiaonensis]
MISKTAIVDGITMRWEETGEGTPVVLIHGIPTSPALWRHVAPRIPKARCLAWEMVGYGESIPEGRDRDISVGRQADYLASWLEHLGIEQAILVGHDLGGGVAQIAAVRYSGLCRGLFLTNAIGYDSWPIPSVKAMRMGGPLLRHLPDLAFKQVIRTFLQRGHDDSTRAKEAFEAHWPHYRKHDGAAAFVRQANSLDVQDTMAVAGDLPGLGIPARIVWGAADQFQKMEYGERFAHDLSAPLQRIEGGKHFTPEDHPEIIANGINQLMADAADAESTTGAGGDNDIASGV